ncbi:hypothetical protein BX659_1392 [Orenia metallireducens]|uniref:Uncharacterized protein n=1 Tax=Orenia metallireducens TaxID=1413210 RepID=A0A285IEC5_9FIRM|nr:hypothetical protein [Orenia metallireducens]PRX19221.1 hypothetical protein BX659_1392 [Orenia metallireducens]SNY46302.1 hypothetical protein SAMN06265827_14128 [Orenia metallireducens]
MKDILKNNIVKKKDDSDYTIIKRKEDKMKKKYKNIYNKLKKIYIALAIFVSIEVIILGIISFFTEGETIWGVLGWIIQGLILVGLVFSGIPYSIENLIAFFNGGIMHSRFRNYDNRATNKKHRIFLAIMNVFILIVSVCIMYYFIIGIPLMGIKELFK